MLWNSLSKSLIVLIAVMHTASAIAQIGFASRGHSNEPLPTLIIPQDGMLPRNGNLKNNRIQINSVQWSVSGKLDKVVVYPDLTFDFIRTYNFRIIPSMKVNGKADNLPNGDYYIRAVILKPNLDDTVETFEQMSNNFVTSSERVVPVEDGIISTYITFSFPSPTITTIRNRMFIEIIPLQQNLIKKIEFKGTEVTDLKTSKFVANTKLPSVVLAIPFLPNANGDSISTVNKSLASDISYDESIDISAVISEGTRKLNENLSAARIETASDWAKRNRTPVVFDDSEFKKYEAIKTREEACQTLHNSFSYRIKKYKQSTAEIRARVLLKSFCDEDENFVSFQKVQFVNENSKIELINRNGSMSQLGISLSKGNNTSNTWDQSSSYSVGASLGAGAAIAKLSPLEAYGLKIPGLSLSANGNLSVTESLSHSQFQTGATMQNFFLEINRMTLNMKASQVQSCYLLKVNKHHSRLKDQETANYLNYAFGKNRTWGKLVCQSKEAPTVLNESYFHILPAFKGQMIADSADPRNQLINLTLRGYQELNLFTYQIRNYVNDEYRNLIMPHDVITSTVAAEMTPGIQFTKVDLGRMRPGFLERNFYSPKKLEHP